MSAVVFKDFSYAYKGTSKVLDNINLTIPQGSFTAVVGPSGAGKTTLCLAINGVVPHYFGGSLAGQVSVAGKPTIDSSMCELSDRVGTVLEDYESQLVTMTVTEEVAFSLENAGLALKEIAVRTRRVLDLVGLTGYERAAVTSLSGGQKQRLVIAAVLATEPDILVLDEPASALDPEGADELYALLGDLNRQGITIVVVEHDLARVIPFAQQLVLLDHGKLILAGDPARVLTHMWQQDVFRLGVPALWQLRLQLEQAGFVFGKWLTDEQALRELQEFIITSEKEVCRSA
jgi:energy-coupling factor transport system ATP-binding protein